MKFRFVGQYTNGHTSISCHGATFYSDEPSEVTDKEAIRRLSGNVEFEKVGKEEDDPLDEAPSEEASVEGAKKFDHDGDGRVGGSKPKAQRKRKAKK